MAGPRFSGGQAGDRRRSLRDEQLSRCGKPGGCAVRVLGLACATLAATACGAAVAHPELFSTNWEDDSGASIGRIWTRAPTAAVPPEGGVVVGVSSDGTLLGMTLNGANRPWIFAHPLDARPALAGGVVLGTGGGEAF